MDPFLRLLVQAPSHPPPGCTRSQGAGAPARSDRALLLGHLPTYASSPAEERPLQGPGPRLLLRRARTMGGGVRGTPHVRLAVRGLRPPTGRTVGGHVPVPWAG